MTSIDISSGFLHTKTGAALPIHEAEEIAFTVYDEFSSDAPIQLHLIEFASYFSSKIDKTQITVAPDASALHKYDYLVSPRIGLDTLRIKGVIALNMVLPELFEGELSAMLIEPFTDKPILPILYARWKSARNHY